MTETVPTQLRLGRAGVQAEEAPAQGLVLLAPREVEVAAFHMAAVVLGPAAGAGKVGVRPFEDLIDRQSLAWS